MGRDPRQACVAVPAKRSHPYRRELRPIVNLRVLRNNLRIMRKTTPALEALFPKVRQGILAATLTQPEKWCT